MSRVPPLAVLVVEDEPNTREIMALLLTEAGHRVATARNGQEALDAVRAAMPDLVIMDVQMPMMDGLEAVRRLRAEPASRTLPILCVSARSSGTTREEGMRAGCDGYLTKPVAQREIFEAATQLLRARGRLAEDESLA